MAQTIGGCPMEMKAKLSKVCSPVVIPCTIAAFGALVAEVAGGGAEPRDILAILAAGTMTAIDTLCAEGKLILVERDDNGVNS